MKDHQNLQTLFWVSKKVGLEMSFNKSKMNLICDRNMCVKCEALAMSSPGHLNVCDMWSPGHVSPGHVGLACILVFQNQQMLDEEEELSIL